MQEFVSDTTLSTLLLAWDQPFVTDSGTNAGWTTTGICGAFGQLFLPNLPKQNAGCFMQANRNSGLILNRCWRGSPQKSIGHCRAVRGRLMSIRSIASRRV
jgi:hypothetical protein